MYGCCFYRAQDLLQKQGWNMKTRIKELRAQFNMTQEDLARAAGVRRETIVFLEKGKYNPSLKLAHDISKIFALKIEDIFLFDD